MKTPAVAGVIRVSSGGETGIRTRVTLSSKHAFQACALSHSATSPKSAAFHRRDAKVPNLFVGFQTFAEGCASFQVSELKRVNSPRKLLIMSWRISVKSEVRCRHTMSFVNAASVVMSPPGMTPQSRNKCAVA
jgi:hypothetical protein